VVRFLGKGLKPTRKNKSMTEYWKKRFLHRQKCCAKTIQVFYLLLYATFFCSFKSFCLCMFCCFQLAEFRSFFEHVKGLRFDDRPDYDYLKRLFRELFFRKGFSYDNLFDWELLQHLGAHSHATSTGAGPGGMGAGLGGPSTVPAGPGVRGTAAGSGMLGIGEGDREDDYAIGDRDGGEGLNEEDGPEGESREFQGGLIGRVTSLFLLSQNLDAN
jgi:hypothetical protein